MNQDLLNSVAARWSQLGAMLNVQPDGKTPDIEPLLLDTARVSPGNSRIFLLAASWLALYAAYVDDPRLAQLIREELEPADRPTLGLLLDWAREHGSNRSRFNSAIGACRPVPGPRPLFDIELRNAAFARLAEERASDLSRRWGRWTVDFELKTSALRPADWIVKHNPSLSDRMATAARTSAST